MKLKITEIEECTLNDIELSLVRGGSEPVVCGCFCSGESAAKDADSNRDLKHDTLNPSRPPIQM